MAYTGGSRCYPRLSIPRPSDSPLPPNNSFKSNNIPPSTIPLDLQLVSLKPLESGYAISCHRFRPGSITSLPGPICQGCARSVPLSTPPPSPLKLSHFFCRTTCKTPAISILQFHGMYSSVNPNPQKHPVFAQKAAHFRPFCQKNEVFDRKSFPHLDKSAILAAARRFRQQ